MKDHASTLGDFTVTPRLIPISLLAIVIGIVASFAAVALLKLIALFTNLFFFGRFTFAASSPANNHLGWFEILVPVVGALLVGLMARYGSDRIRGHGIPEAIESILMNGSKVQPKVAILKPLSAALSIGSGGPFGAEGPIIVTGGAFGSMIAQLFHLTNHERKTLLVAGSAAGMAATFDSPVAAVLLAVELLLFEWKPRSVIPVALASATAVAARRHLLGLGPIFPTPPHHLLIGAAGLVGCAVVGILAGILSSVLSSGVYATEDLFKKIPLHWMWWPAIGGVVIGIGGLIFPPALGVGYDVIGRILQGDTPRNLILGVLIVKSAIWVFLAGLGHLGRRARSAADDRRRCRWHRGDVSARSGRGVLAANQHGSGPWRNARVALDRGRIRARTDPRRQRADAAPDRGHAVTRVHVADDEALDPDRKDRAARLPRHPRVCGRSARSPLRSGSHAR